LNDATGLTVYKVALVAASAAAPSLSPAPIGSSFVVAAFGIAVGLAVGWVVAWIRSRLSDVPVEITVSLLTPYAAYLPAELICGSAILAAVTPGLYLGTRSSRSVGADTRPAGPALCQLPLFACDGHAFLF